ncbi:MAG: CoB--CoM heterodisulfide reductase iron-sulfur subunit A family protein, partial [Desulfobacterales bacterium]|nr:CoB--CoM heterodisulfide reductase iron-sulfur subunit A family protein [Desulfobacterales bacterium]
VEKSDQLGGFTRNLTATLEGASPRRLVRFLAERTLNHPAITVSLKSELAPHEGSAGDFRGKIRGRMRGEAPGGEETREIRYGAVVAATGGEMHEPREYGFGRDERVVAQVDFAKYLKEDPAGAARLDQVVMIQCVGSRDADFPYCSRVCCSAAIKNSILLKEMNPDARVVVLYRDVRTFGFKELYYQKAREKGVLFFRYIPEEKPRVYDDGGRLTVDFTDRASHQEFRIAPDKVVLSAGIRPNEGARRLARVLKLPLTKQGFFLEAHVKLRPVEFGATGIFLAGLAHSPRFIEETISMAKSAGQQAVKILCREEMTTSAETARVDEDRCAACLVCVRVCPFGAPFINEQGVSEIPPTACMGCGVCASECPAEAITLNHNTNDQITAKIDALLEAVV